MKINKQNSPRHYVRPCSNKISHHVLFPGLPEHDKHQKTETVKVWAL